MHVFELIDLRADLIQPVFATAQCQSVASPAGLERRHRFWLCQRSSEL